MRAALAVRPLFVPKDNGDVVHIGSSVLLRIHNVCFVVTAAHVLRSAPPNVALYVGTPSGMPEIDGRQVKSVPTPGGTGHDLVDLGLVALEPECIGRLSDCVFLTTDDIDVDDQVDSSPIVGTNYLAMGYPHELVTFSREGSTYQARLVPWIGKPRSNSDVESMLLHPASHAMVEFDGERIAERLGRDRPVHPRGMSGGGLFRFELSPTGSVPPEKLVAILIEEQLETHSALLATRIAFVTEGIRAKFPDLSEYIPKPRRISLNAGEGSPRTPLGENRVF